MFLTSFSSPTRLTHPDQTRKPCITTPACIMTPRTTRDKPDIWSALASPIGKKVLTGITGLAWTDSLSSTWRAT